MSNTRRPAQPSAPLMQSVMQQVKQDGIQIGLALSGGTARSVCHVGVLRALAECGFCFHQVAGTSGGAIVAACWAAGMPIEQMERVANDLTWGKLAALRISRRGFVSSKRIEKMVQNMLGEVRFEDLQMPCAVITTDFYNGERCVFSEGPVARVVRASCSLPQIFLPVKIGQRYHVDGGLSEYLPVDSARALGADFVVAVNLGKFDSDAEMPRNIIQIALQFINIMARRNMEVSLQHADFVIEPDVSDFGVLDFSVSGEVITCGYREATSQVQALQESIVRFLMQKNKGRWYQRWPNYMRYHWTRLWHFLASTGVKVRKQYYRVFSFLHARD